MIGVLLLLACTPAPTDPADGAPPVVDDFGPLPAFSLTDQGGRTVTHKTLSGSVWVASFMFTTCPDVCPTLTAHMAEVQTRYRDRPDLRLVSFSVDPVTDTPPVLAAYAARFHADPVRWHFLTGPLDDVRAVVVAGFKQAMEAQPAVATEPATILHGSRFAVVDRKGHLRAFPEPNEPGKAGLWAAIDAVLAEPRE